jgi:hypothetical protein
MMLYTRHQLLLVLLVVAAAGAGLALDHWRRASPDVVERLERADRTERPTPAPREPRRGARAPRGPTAPESQRASRDAHTREQARHDALTPDVPLDVNRASAPELARLPGVGRVLAARIVDARPFAALDDLTRVHGLRRATLERVRPLLAVPPPLGRGTLPGFPSSPP